MNNDSAKKYKLTLDVNNEVACHGIMFGYINPKACVLDVGCACGDFGVVLHSYKQCKCYGLEYNEGSVKIAKETGYYADVKQFDLDSFEKIPFDLKFDYIVFGDVLEHLRNPMEILNKFKNYLNENGRFIISLPNVSHASIKSNLLINNFNYTPLGLLDNTHIRFFTYKSIAKNFADIGLKIETCKHSFCQKQEVQPVDAFKKLPISINKFILKDWHSYVLQYVMSVYISDENSEELFKSNIQLTDINEHNAHKAFKYYRRKQLKNYIYKPIFIISAISIIVIFALFIITMVFIADCKI